MEKFLSANFCCQAPRLEHWATPPSLWMTDMDPSGTVGVKIANQIGFILQSCVLRSGHIIALILDILAEYIGVLRPPVPLMGFDKR